MQILDYAKIRIRLDAHLKRWLKPNLKSQIKVSSLENILTANVKKKMHKIDVQVIKSAVMSLLIGIHSGNYFVIVETIFFIQNFEFIEKIIQKFH